MNTIYYHHQYPHHPSITIIIIINTRMHRRVSSEVQSSTHPIYSTGVLYRHHRRCYLLGCKRSTQSLPDWPNSIHWSHLICIATYALVLGNTALELAKSQTEFCFFGIIGRTRLCTGCTTASSSSLSLSTLSLEYVLLFLIWKYPVCHWSSVGDE